MELDTAHKGANPLTCRKPPGQEPGGLFLFL